MSDYTDVLTNTQTLISFKSVTPNDAGCQDWLASAFASLGYNCEQLDHNEVKNLLAIPKLGLTKNTVLFVGHTDVVPTQASKWHTDPFTPTIIDNKLYGRGTVDMKSSIAAMLAAVSKRSANSQYSDIAFLITSNEEGETDFGIEHVLKHFSHKIKPVTNILIGEPTSDKSVGDMIKIGRRGSLNLKIDIVGKSGHTAYPKQCSNPIDSAQLIINALTKHTWGTTFPNFDLTKMTIVGINASNDVFNTTPEHCTIKVNWRFNPSLKLTDIKETTELIVKNISSQAIKTNCTWYNGTEPFYNENGKFAKKLKSIIEKNTQRKTTLSTTGGTSDARFFKGSHYDLVEFGPKNQMAHKINEHISLNDLESLTKLYGCMLDELATEYNTLDHLI